VIGCDDDRGLAEIAPQLAGHDLARVVVVLRVLGVEHLKPVPDCDTGHDLRRQQSGPALVPTAYHDVSHLSRSRHGRSRRGSRAKALGHHRGHRRTPGAAMAARHSRAARSTKLLANPIYVGEIAHGELRYPGQHAAIVDRAIWDRVQQQLSNNAHEHRGSVNAGYPSLLAGVIVDDAGASLVATDATKRGVRYRYYVSRALQHGTKRSGACGMRIPAAEIEPLVTEQIASLVADPIVLCSRLATRSKPTAPAASSMRVGRRRSGCVREARSIWSTPQLNGSSSEPTGSGLSSGPPPCSPPSASPRRPMTSSRSCSTCPPP